MVVVTVIVTELSLIVSTYILNGDHAFDTENFAWAHFVVAMFLIFSGPLSIVFFIFIIRKISTIGPSRPILRSFYIYLITIPISFALMPIWTNLGVMFIVSNIPPVVGFVSCFILMKIAAHD